LRSIGFSGLILRRRLAGRRRRRFGLLLAFVLLADARDRVWRVPVRRP
jgi:hypothetical protein